MTEFRYQDGHVYIFENSKAQRVKVGMTTCYIVDRLDDLNDIWAIRKGTCQICGGRRLVYKNGFMPQHPYSGPNHLASSRYCSGGNELPLEKDVTLAESHLEKIKNLHTTLTSSDKGSATRVIKSIEKRIEKFSNYKRPIGVWRFGVSFYTKCAEQVELLTHEILEKQLDKQAPLGEVFCCSVSEATEAVETVLSQLGLIDSAKKETKMRRK